MPDIINAVISRRAQYPRPPATLKELLYRYQSTPEVRELGDESIRQIGRAVRRIVERFPKLPIEQVEDPSFRSQVYDWRDEMADTRSECERMVQILSRALSFGLDRRFIKVNQAADIQFRWRKKPAEGRANIIWTPNQLVSLRKHAGGIRDVIELALWSALRQGDVLDLEKSQVRDGWIIVTPAKTRNVTGVTVEIPYTLIPPLQKVVDRLLAAENDSTYLLGARLSDRERSFRRAFDKAKSAAGLGDEDLHFHDLRGTLLTWLYEAGCTEAEAASISGHALAESTLRAYVARTKALPEAAFTKLRTYLERKHDDLVLQCRLITRWGR